MLTSMDVHSHSDDSNSGYIGATIVLIIVSVLLLVGIIVCYVKYQMQKQSSLPQPATELEEKATDRDLIN